MLKPREIAFANALVAGATQKDAWIKAGYSAKSGSAAAARKAADNRIREYVQSGLAAKQKSAEGESERILDELRKVAFGSLENLIRIDDEGLPQIDFSNATKADLDALSSVATKRRKIYNGKGEHVATEDTAKFTRLDKLRGLELLGKHHGMFKEQHEVEVVDVAARILQARQARQQRALPAPDDGSES